MSKHTEAELAEQVAGLRRLKRVIPRRSTGRPNYSQHDAIDAQINVLRYGLTLPAIKAQYQDEIQGAAEDARYWADGGEIFSPVESWADVEKKTLENTGFREGTF